MVTHAATRFWNLIMHEDMSDNSDNAAKVLSHLEAMSARKQCRSIADPIALAIHQLLHPLFESSAKAFNV